MNWHVLTVSRADLDQALNTIRVHGGTVTATRPESSGVAITYVAAATAPAPRAP